MPTPLEILIDPVSLVVLAMYVALIAWEALFPARPLPFVKYWKLKGFVFFTLFFFLSSYLPLIWDEALSNYQVFDLTWLGAYWGALAGVLIYQFGLYIWHRSMHSSSLLWRIFHQMHHSVERVDTYSAFIFSPMDMIGFTALGSLMLVVVAGFSPEAATLIILINTFFSIFQHSNIRTPQWIGYLIQRPEAHSYHHAKNIHSSNYGDITIYDILFRTWKNPKGREYENGFYMGASSKILDMLLFKDINQKKNT